MSNWNDSKGRPCGTLRCADADQHQNRNGHNATNRKAAGSVPDEVIGLFNWPNSSIHTKALGLTLNRSFLGERRGEGRFLLTWGHSASSRLESNVTKRRSTVLQKENPRCGGVNININI
jgi:hypothetical protein